MAESHCYNLEHREAIGLGGLYVGSAYHARSAPRWPCQAVTLRGSLMVISRSQSWVKHIKCMQTNYVSYDFYRPLDVDFLFILRDNIRAQPQRFFMF